MHGERQLLTAFDILTHMTWHQARAGHQYFSTNGGGDASSIRLPRVALARACVVDRSVSRRQPAETQE